MPPPRPTPPPQHLRLRSLYRAFLRELPPSPSAGTGAHLRHRLRTHFATETAAVSDEPAVTAAAAAAAAAAEQHLHFLRAQRAYSVLLERYNPGMAGGAGDMEVEAERIRASARRVGVDLPAEREGERGRGGGGDGDAGGR